ncbi:hypothetical protein CPB86DRAFT_788511 [Serendipita vermifera]|nr:hypothetical protein CPB86DRAFT_788511 [Serendipita vermifera]
MTYPVTVSNLSSTSSEKSISEFFSFCGKISSIQYDAAAHSAVIHFEKEQAAKTALMLNGGTLDGVAVHVGSDAVSDDHDQPHPRTSLEGDHLEQHDKPRAGIVAEMLAKGYAISESILHKAIAVDQQQGISTRFLNYIRGLDSTIGQKIGGPETTVSGKAKEALAQGQEQARAIDEQHQISKQAHDYYSKAISSAFGQKVVAFYTSTAKQVQDVHEEAMRIAALEKEKAAAAANNAEHASAEASASH